MIKKESSLFKNDQILSNIITQIDKPIVVSTRDIFHDLMSCIIEQQIHYRSTKRVFAKALVRAKIHHLTLDNFQLFEKQSLSQIKLAHGKYETMMNFIKFWSKNTKDFSELSDDEVRKELSSIKGIGNWTIDMILLYTLQRPNIFPADDFHLKQIMIALYELNEKVKLKAQMIAIAETWEQYKSLAVLYLLDYKKSKMQKIKSKN